MIVYIAGPYTSAPEQNTKRAIEVGHDVMDSGMTPYVPHLSHYMEAVRQRPYEDWMKIDFEFILCADVLVRLIGMSSGTERETEFAIKHAVPIITETSEASWEIGGLKPKSLVSALMYASTLSLHDKLRS